jgi:hypothetical protein
MKHEDRLQFSCKVELDRGLTPYGGKNWIPAFAGMTGRGSPLSILHQPSFLRKQDKSAKRVERRFTSARRVYPKRCAGHAKRSE